VIYITFVFFADLYSFQRLAGPIRPAVAAFSDFMLNAALPSPFRRKETAWVSTPSPAPHSGR
jgi:hypothetical protein